MSAAGDRERALALTPVSRETEARLDRFVELLLLWQERMNLVAASTLPLVWTRHIADSLQLLPIVAGASAIADLGSGAGFPGLILGCALADQSAVPAHRCVHLVESNTKKAAFLREAVRVTGAAATIHAVRAETFVETAPPLEAVTARAFAPLGELLGIAYPLLKKGAIGVFPKGQDVAVELTDAAKCWKIQHRLIPSLTDPRAQIIVVTAIDRATGRQQGSGQKRKSAP